MKKVVSKLLHPHHSSHSHESHDHTNTTTKHKDHVDSSGMVVNKTVESPLEETIVRPTIIEEVQVEKEVIEVQPVIHRVIEVPEVHHIERHVYEKVLPAGPNVITKEPIVDVTIQPRIVDEVTTIVHREVPETYVIHEEQHINQFETRPTIHTTTIVNDTASIETTTADSHLRAIAEPHERMPPSPHKLESTTTWVSAYPAAMLQMASHHSGEHHASGDTKHVHKEEHKVHEKKVEKKSYEEHTKEAKGKDKDKDKLRKGKEKVKEEIKEKINDTKEKLKPQQHKKAQTEEAEDKAQAGYRESSSITVPLAEKPQHEDPFDHPVFVHRTVEHSSLDIRAQLSLERRADLQCQDSFELPGFSAPHVIIDRGTEDLEKGSTIGLTKEESQQHAIETTQRQQQKQQLDKVSAPSQQNLIPKEKTPPTKLEKELRSHNTDLAGAFVVSSLKSDQ